MCGVGVLFTLQRDWLDRLEEAKKIQAAASTQKRGLTEQILQSPAGKGG